MFNTVYNTGDSKSANIPKSQAVVFSARGAVGGKFSGRTYTIYQFYVSVHEYYYAVCTSNKT